MHFFPAMKAAALAHSSDGVGKCMMYIMEKHLVPAGAAAKDNSHSSVEQRPRPIRIIRKEAVPRQRMCEIRDEHPGKREANAAANRYGHHEPPALGQRSVKRVCAHQPNACPDGRDEALMVDTARQPLFPELLVAFATGGTIREVTIPLESKEPTGVVEADEVDERDEWHRKHEQVSFVSPLLHEIMDLFRIPTEFTLEEQILGTRMVPIVLEDEVLPRQ